MSASCAICFKSGVAPANRAAARLERTTSELRPVSGLFLAALHAGKDDHALLVPGANAGEVALSGHAAAWGAATLREAAGWLAAGPADAALHALLAGDGTHAAAPTLPALADVAGQWQAKRALIIAAAQVQAARERRLRASGVLSARLSAPQLRQFCALSELSERLLRRSCQQLGLSGRGVHRLLALGRTIADLAGSELIEPPHLAEAIQLRRPLL